MVTTDSNSSASSPFLPGTTQRSYSLNWTFVVHTIRWLLPPPLATMTIASYHMVCLAHLLLFFQCLIFFFSNAHDPRLNDLHPKKIEPCPRGQPRKNRVSSSSGTPSSHIQVHLITDHRHLDSITTTSQAFVSCLLFLVLTQDLISFSDFSLIPWQPLWTSPWILQFRFVCTCQSL